MQVHVLVARTAALTAGVALSACAVPPREHLVWREQVTVASRGDLDVERTTRLKWYESAGHVTYIVNESTLTVLTGDGTRETAAWRAGFVVPLLLDWSESLNRWTLIGIYEQCDQPKDSVYVQFRHEPGIGWIEQPLDRSYAGRTTNLLWTLRSLPNGRVSAAEKAEARRGAGTHNYETSIDLTSRNFCAR